MHRFYRTQPVEVLVTYTDTAKPVANQQVELSYRPETIFQGRPTSVVATTDEQGRAQLTVADLDFPLMLQVVGASFSFDPEPVRTGGALNSKDDEEKISIRLMPCRPTLLQRLFGFGVYGTCGAL
jgi:hypothetical protein